ncbi:hypothetical protein AZE42_02265 [Rhizopogon vesiculosus]|uniref:Serine hydrolase domain-containing protein n=1 Tax=Rhizopogon vesiculosus TaxID=180088 RepID=A0A1J8R685_9AGAM|nr:hypothetical protein AZE42_02265 [Rhizopogon vesiculosus]
MGKYAQNANIFSKHLVALRESMGKDIELVFVDGPIVIHPVDPGGSSASTSLAVLKASEADMTSSDPSATPRAWFKLNPERTAAHGLENTLLYLRDILQRDRYDGVFGFSQGASIAALLSALLERPHTYSPFLIDGEAPHPPFKFCVSVSGFKLPGYPSTQIFGTSYSTPTLHVLGRTDVVVIEEWSKALLNFSQNKRVEEHVGGHFVPSRGKWRKIFRDYLVDPLGRFPESTVGSQSGFLCGGPPVTRSKLVYFLVSFKCN